MLLELNAILSGKLNLFYHLISNHNFHDVDMMRAPYNFDVIVTILHRMIGLVLAFQEDFLYTAIKFDTARISQSVC
jgi:hypothetical protein